MKEEREITDEEYDRAREQCLSQVSAMSSMAEAIETVMIPAARAAGEEAGRRHEAAFWEAFLGDASPTVVESSP